ncbi:DNA/RNA non-specific endonuclease [Butyrivibrio sp. AC2005]|uniref:DNA/RNA non-specific endonuclease n=1 Tax=Butyrivibrio sp. AC2005 TaxID=1280672 RepID=UPI0004084004|nr:DNA/RNA non-specific endonuclease [Butyrivibrio sp. AC2005]
MKRENINYKRGIGLALGLILSLFVCTPISATAKPDIPAYDGKVSIAINENIPTFSSSEITTISYEKYGELDKLGRCTAAEACVGKELMPTEKRGSIGMIKPTGWNQNKYEGLVNSNPPYLYNRCHLIGYQLTGENANEKNLITGTRYFNIEGMLPYEDEVADYVKNSSNHVMYRVTPIFDGDNLLCKGVQMEAYSVEDKGKAISFNVFCYNVQPGVILNYSDGTNYKDENYVSKTSSKNETPQKLETTSNIEKETTATTTNDNTAYIANRNTKKFHYQTCSSVSEMKEKNKLYYNGTREELIEQGYAPCKRCNP